MMWPDTPQVTLRAWATSSEVGRVSEVEVLGHGTVQFVQDSDGLHVSLPAEHTDDIAPVLAIRSI